MSDTNHLIPDEIVTRAARLINEAENMRQQSADSLKSIYADLRDDLKQLGWDGKVISAEVAALKGAIAEMRLDDEKKAKRDDKEEHVGDYVSVLSRARAREAAKKSVRDTLDRYPVMMGVLRDIENSERSDMGAVNGDASIPADVTEARGGGLTSAAPNNSHSSEPTSSPAETDKAEATDLLPGSSASPINSEAA